MSAQLRNLWKTTQQTFARVRGYVRAHRLGMITVAVCVAVCALIGWAAYLRWGLGWGWIDTGFGPYVDADGKFQRGKTLWDWMQLLIIPAVLALGALLFNRQEKQNEMRIAEERRKSDLEIADNRNQEMIIQNYLDKMSELIIEKKLMDVKSTIEKAYKENPRGELEIVDQFLTKEQLAVWDMARTRTETVLRQLNENRRNIILRFVLGVGLSSILLEKAQLERADLSFTLFPTFNLRGANLVSANLYRAILFSANLGEAFLVDANLSGSELSSANLRGAYMKRAKLVDARLERTFLNGADLIEADLRGAFVSNEQLASAKSLTGAIMPNGQKFDPAIHNFWIGPH